MLFIHIRKEGKVLVTQFSSVVQSCLKATQWTVAPQASLSITNSQSLLKLMCFMPSIFPASASFPMSQFFTSGGQTFGVSTSASGFPMNIQD